MENLIDTAPEDLNKNKDIDTWVANIKSFTEEFKEYVDKIHQLDASIDTTIKKLQDTYDNLIAVIGASADSWRQGWRSLKILEKILCTGNSNKWLFSYQATDFLSDFLSPEEYVWMILCDKKDQGKPYSDMPYNSLEKLNEATDQNLKDFCEHFNKIASSKADLLNIKTKMERFLNKQP